MRVWDIHPSFLSRQHLLGEHNEIHAIYTMIATGKGGSYQQHPEVLRWKGKLLALSIIHDRVAKELEARGYNHNSPLDFSLVTNWSEQKDVQDKRLLTEGEQIELLKEKDAEHYNFVFNKDALFIRLSDSFEYTTTGEPDYFPVCSICHYKARSAKELGMHLADSHHFKLDLNNLQLYK